jgi:hypothetical protein
VASQTNRGFTEKFLRFLIKTFLWRKFFFVVRSYSNPAWGAADNCQSKGQVWVFSSYSR